MTLQRLVIAIVCVFAAATGVWSVVQGEESAMSESVFEAEVAAAYPDAPEGVQAVAIAIRAGETPNTNLLQNLGPDALSASYLGTNRTLSILLNDTLIFNNPDAATALVAAGADVNYADHLMLFNALDMTEGATVLPFPNYSPGIPFLRLYLENGGNPNAQYKRDSSNRAALIYAYINLEGILLLLEHGADPWLEPLNQDGNKMRHFFDTRAGNASGIVAAELLFRVIHAGHMSSGTPEQVQGMLDKFEARLKSREGSQGARDRLSVWYAQQIVDAILATTGAQPSAELARLMSDRIPDQYGGWHLPPDAVRSDQSAAGQEIVQGSLIWTHADPTPRPRPAE